MARVHGRRRAALPATSSRRSCASCRCTPCASSAARSSPSARSWPSTTCTDRAARARSSRDEAARGAAAAHRARRRAWRAWHRALEARRCRSRVLTLVAVLIGGVVEFVPTALVRSNVPTIATVKPVHAARGRGPRPLHPRRLRRLPLADGPPDPGRDRTLRRVLEGRRVRLRPPVPVGIEADRPRPASRRRQVSRLVALPAHAAAVGDVAGLDHAGLSVALRRSALDTSHIEGKIITLRRLGVPYPEGYEQPRGASDLRAPGGTASPARLARRRACRPRQPIARSSRSSPTCSASAPTSRRRPPSAATAGSRRRHRGAR